jgi:hypothetical protein
VPEFANLPVEDLTAIWERQAQKLVESGVPRERVADSLRIAALNFESRTLSLAAQELIASFRATPGRSAHRDAVPPMAAQPAPGPRAEDDKRRNADTG